MEAEGVEIHQVAGRKNTHAQKARQDEGRMTDDPLRMPESHQEAAQSNSHPQSRPQDADFHHGHSP